jgi:protein arginine kinase activator
MNCHMCGRREATIHLLELINGQQKSLWLCGICASGRSELPTGAQPEPVLGGAGQSPGESASLASFLGQVLDGAGPPRQVSDCPVCGYALKAFQTSNRLGCAACYDHFRVQLVPILTQYHRHATHLGKVPQRVGGAARQQGELTRLRVALEKAIQSEAYEEAAHLRDTLRAMTAARDVQRGQVASAAADDGGQT